LQTEDGLCFLVEGPDKRRAWQLLFSAFRADGPDFSEEPWFVQKAPEPTLITDFQAYREYLTGGGIDVILLTVTRVELEAVQKRFEKIDRSFLGGPTVFLGKAGPLSVAVVHQVGSCGPWKAVDLTKLAIEKLCPRVIISVGIAWGNKNHWEKPGFGDVLVSARLVNFTGDTAALPTQFESRDEQPAAGKNLIGFFSNLNWSFSRFRIYALCR
jgi:hypothetical protein